MTLRIAMDGSLVKLVAHLYETPDEDGEVRHRPVMVWEVAAEVDYGEAKVALTLKSAAKQGLLDRAVDPATGDRGYVPNEQSADPPGLFTHTAGEGARRRRVTPAAFGRLTPPDGDDPEQ